MATAATLIARVAIQGMGEFQSDITRAHSLFQGLSNVTGSFFRTLEVGAAAGIGAFGTFTSMAVQEAVKIEGLTVSFAALHHSMAMGAQQMDFLRGVAKHTVIDLDDLAAASLRMESTGLNSGRFIEMAAQMGRLMTPGSAQGMLQVADALGRIASGQNMGMAMRSIGRFISYNDLRGEGVDISKNNHINSSSEQVLGAMERVFQRKFGDLGGYLDNTMATAFSNLNDAWTLLLSKFGAAWFPLIKSIIDTLVPFMDFLSNGGEIEKIAKSFASLFDGMKDGGWIRILMFGVAVLEDLPNIIRGVWEYVKTFMSGFGNLLVGFIDLIVEGIGRMVTALHEIAPIVQMLGGVASAVGASTGSHPGGREVMRGGFPNPFDWIASRWGAERRGDGTQGNSAGRWAAIANAGNAEFGGTRQGGARTEFEKFFAQLPQIGSIFDHASKRTDQLMAEFNKYVANPKQYPGNPAGDAMFNENHAAMDGLNTQKEIADNTGRIAAHMEHFKRFALGGGDRGRVGITVAEMYGSASTVRMDLGRAATHFERGMHEVSREMYQGMRRAGLGN